MSPAMMTRRELLFGRLGDQETATSLSEDESGATAIEYGLILGLLAMALIPVLSRTGRRTRRPLRCARNTMRRARKGRDIPKCAE